MKSKLLYTVAFSVAALGMNSCMDFDDPRDEIHFGQEQDQGNDQLYVGEVDKIVYDKEIPLEAATQAIEELGSKLGLSLSAQRDIRGGKNADAKIEPHSYQYQYCLDTDGYAQYAVVPHYDFFGGPVMTSTYDISKDFNGAALGSYSETAQALLPLLNHPAIDSIPEIKAINLLYLSIAAQEKADLSGPFTYFQDKQNNPAPDTYNSVEDIYKNIVTNLTDIVACLQYNLDNPRPYQEQLQQLLKDYCKTNRYENGVNVSTFIKLANSLKLRMAMNIVKVDPVLAQQWAEEAVEGGVIETYQDQHGIYTRDLGFQHPLANIQTGWHDENLSASFESLLMSLKHPFVTPDKRGRGFLFMNNTDKIINRNTQEVLAPDTRVVGIRAGVKVGQGQSPAGNHYVSFSTVKPSEIAQAPLYYIKLSEVEFLRAEGALRGWNMGGTAQQFYEQGILHSSQQDYQTGRRFADAEKRLQEYAELEKPVDYVQVDPIGDGEPWPSVTKIGVKWNDADDNETKLEKIITQKYIAVFPNSWVAWNDLRRTGYPKLFPVQNPDDGDGSLSYGEIIRRIPWLPQDPIEIKKVNESGLPALGPGATDTQGQRIWWDVDAPNF